MINHHQHGISAIETRTTRMISPEVWSDLKKAGKAEERRFLQQVAEELPMIKIEDMWWMLDVFFKWRFVFRYLQTMFKMMKPNHLSCEKSFEENKLLDDKDFGKIHLFSGVKHHHNLFICAMTFL